MKAAIEVAAVIIPAHDERNDVVATLASLSSAADAAVIPVIGVLVLDACTDGTREVVDDFFSHDRSTDWHCVETRRRCASSSRSDGLSIVANLVAQDFAADRVAVLTTDADTEVPRNWILDHVRRLDDGADAVAGVVDLASAADADLSYESWRAEYTTLFRGDGTHPHVHCANLAVRLDVLVAAGGFGHLARAEDIDLWRRLKEMPEVRLRSEQASVVRTSQRLDGRVVGGFATALQQFRMTPEKSVVSPVIIETAVPTSPRC